MTAKPWIALAVFTSSLHFGCLAADPDKFNPDDLKRTAVAGQGEKQVVVTQWNDQSWRVTNLSVFSNDEIIADSNVCFEAKFAVADPNGKVRLLGTPGKLQVDEQTRKTIARRFKFGDNIWVFGTLTAGAEGKRSVTVVEMFPLAPDIERFENRLTALLKAGDGEGLVAFGVKVEEHAKNLPVGIPNPLELQDRCAALRKKAIESGLIILEKKLDPKDAEGHFSLARKWLDLLNGRVRWSELVKAAVKIDPNHAAASRVAKDQLGMVKDATNTWRTPKELQDIADIDAQNARLRDEDAKKAEQVRLMALEKEISIRAEKLAIHMTALRTDDIQKRDGAIQSLGAAVGECVDADFAREAVDILVNLESPTAVMALNVARSSKLTAVRRLVFDALVWRGLCAGKDDSALFAITSGLKAEKDVPTAKAGIDALVAAGGPGAVGVLVASLDTADQAVMAEAIDGLKRSTKLNYPSREGWQDWWSKTKNTVAPDAFRN